MKAVTIVTIPNIGKTAEVIAPTSWPALATINDISPLAEAIPKPVLKAVISSYPFALVSIAVIIKNFDANEVRISNIAGTMSKGK